MEGHTRPTEETHQAEETTQLLTLGVLYTPDGSRIRPRQWRPPVRNLVLGDGQGSSSSGGNPRLRRAQNPWPRTERQKGFEDGAGQNKKAGDGAGGQKWCSGYKPTRSDTEYYVQGAPRAQTTAGTHTAAELSVDTDERSTINFDDDIAKGFKF